MPWDNPEVYDRWSPSHFAKDFQTPTLVVHGELDYRVPYTQGLELFTALENYFHFYNHQRPHQALGYQTPADLFPYRLKRKRSSC